MVVAHYRQNGVMVVKWGRWREDVVCEGCVAIARYSKYLEWASVLGKLLSKSEMSKESIGLRPGAIHSTLIANM